MSLSRVIPLTVFVFVLGLLSPLAVESQNVFGTTPSSAPDPAALSPLVGVSDLTVQPLQFLTVQNSPELLVEVELAGQTLTLSLFPHSIRSDEYRVLVDDGTGNLTEVPAPPIVTRRGTVLQVADSSITASWTADGLSATIELPTRTFSIQPVVDFAPGHGAEWHVVFDHNDMLALGHTCGVSSSGSIGGSGSGGVQAFGGPTLQVAEIAFDVDFEAYTELGQSIVNTVNTTDSIVNGMEGAFDEPGILIGYELTTIVIRTNSADPYGTETNIDNLLTSFRNNWNSAPESAIDRDVAHLLSGVEFAGPAIGYATVGAICNSFSYGMTQLSFSSSLASRTGVVTHELGHNWDADHCNGATTCRIMCSVFDACGGISPLIFAPGSASSISSYRNTRNCLSTRPPANSIPFFEPFATTGLSSSRWTYNRGGVITSQGVSEPSGSLSIVLDSDGGGTWSDDELRSNFIELQGLNDPHLSFFTQHRGVESGEELVVEYLNSALHWIELDRYTSDGVDEAVYTERVYPLPIPARHNKFRVKFRTEGNSATDDWFIDDILVDNGPPTPAVPPTLVLIQPDTGTLNGQEEITIFGTDFQAGATVTIGTGVLQNVVFVDDTEIRGNVPLASSAGSVNVLISQDSGSDILNDAFIYTAETIRHGLGTAAPGSLTTVPVTGDHESPLTGFSVAVDFDASLIEIVEVTDVGTDIEGADFFQPAYDNTTGAAGGWWTLGVILSLSNTTTLPANNGSVLALATYSIDGSLPLGVTIPLTPVSGIGSPSTENLLVGLQGAVLVPALESGEIVTSGVLFVRGDTNDDNSIDIADAIGILGFLFSNEPATCLDAYDGNDDGQVNIADAISVLDFLFSQGPPPPAPFPTAGTDPTNDPLDCT